MDFHPATAITTAMEYGSKKEYVKAVWFGRPGLPDSDRTIIYPRLGESNLPKAA